MVFVLLKDMGDKAGREVWKCGCGGGWKKIEWINKVNNEKLLRRTEEERPHGNYSRKKDELGGSHPEKELLAEKSSKMKY